MIRERKEKEGYLAHLDIGGLLDRMESLEIPEVLVSQECQVPKVIWVIKESKVAQAFQELKAFQVLQDSQVILGQ